MMVKVTFRVKVSEVKSGCSMFVVGNCSELGLWKPKLAKPLQLYSKSGSSEIWTGSFVTNTASIQYRYFIGLSQLVTKESVAEEIVFVHEWETFKLPRTQKLVNVSEVDIEDLFGHVDGIVSVDKGWLTGQTALHFTLRDDAVQFFNATYRTGFVKFLVVSTKNSNKDSNSGGTHANEKLSYLQSSCVLTDVVASVLNEEKNHHMPHDRVSYKPGDTITFKIETGDAESLAYKLVIGAKDELKNTDCYVELGFAYLSPVNTNVSKDTLITSIISKEHDIIGQIKVDVLAIKSVNYDWDMSSCFIAVQKPTLGQVWFIGHRGMGRSLRNGVHQMYPGENTISSLNQAIRTGANFVEFDVMLSKDQVPILHHDFVTSINLQETQEGKKRIIVPVQDLHYADLQNLQTPGLAGCTVMENLKLGIELEEDLPFPHLKSCLMQVDPHAGFNIEIKYCMELKKGELEEGLTHFSDRNDYIDSILYEILHHSGCREIILSSFDPDVCVMLRAKQNRCPVLFLTQGQTVKYPQYMDPRTWTVDAAIQFAVTESLCGVCVHTEDLLKDVTLIEKAKKNGLWVLCWGDDNNNSENIKLLIYGGVHGLIIDNIDKFLPLKGF